MLFYEFINPLEVCKEFIECERSFKILLLLLRWIIFGRGGNFDVFCYFLLNWSFLIFSKLLFGDFLFI